MSAKIGAQPPMVELEDKLLHLQCLTEANEFMIDFLKEQGAALKEMGAEEARTLLRKAARLRFGPDAEAGANPDVLAILEETLGTGETAEIIAFPANQTIH